VHLAVAAEILEKADRLEIVVEIAIRNCTICKNPTIFTSGGDFLLVCDSLPIVFVKSCEKVTISTSRV